MPLMILMTNPWIHTTPGVSLFTKTITMMAKYIVPRMMIIATIITLTMIMIIIMMMMMIPDSRASSSSEEDFVSYNIPSNLIIDMHGNRFTIDDNKKVIPV